ncbi:MAG: D-alanyl-D-alanine carboxypeptidase/D-alanyl-D-alanine endopeptidase [Bacteroidota bacterium]|jgi:D-alanyl-D-alanine carboxypeptidase/D-alanyl-D-alanine-endopeptidase (penicillin-binding protein 4)
MKAYISILSIICLLLAPQTNQAQQQAQADTLKHFSLHRNKKLGRQISQLPVFRNAFVGLCVYDTHKQKYVVGLNHQQYFTPASNVKLFTFYAASRYIGTQLPAFKYQLAGDTLLIQSTGYPLWAHPSISDTSLYNFLRRSPQKIVLTTQHFADAQWGSGWAWDDQLDNYAAEKSQYPFSANLLTITVQQNAVKTHPSYFQQFTQSEAGNSIQITRHPSQNKITVRYNPNETTSQSVQIPYITSEQLSAKLIGQWLGRNLETSKQSLNPAQATHTFYSPTARANYARILQDSDNFLAEQTLYMCADSLQLSDGITTKKIIDKLQTELFGSITNPPRWVDGSGLSRYNLFTPQSFVEVLQQTRAYYANDSSLFALFPEGGTRGSLKNRFTKTPPFLYAKTGTLSNNHNLSGYLVTKSGKTLIFSFMANHYLASYKQISAQMDYILTQFYERY